VGLPVLIPMFGAFVASKEQVRSRVDMGEIALAGPIVGTAASFACLALGHVFGGRLWPYLGLIGLYLNLFNLIPTGFLDGGRIAKALTMWLWIPGLVLLGYLFLAHHNVLLLLIGFLGLGELVARYRQRTVLMMQEQDPRDTLRNRMLLGALYFALVALISLTMLHNPAFGWGTL